MRGTVKETIVITVSPVGKWCSAYVEIKLPSVCFKQQKMREPENKEVFIFDAKRTKSESQFCSSNVLEARKCLRNSVAIREYN